MKINFYESVQFWIIKHSASFFVMLHTTKSAQPITGLREVKKMLARSAVSSLTKKVVLSRNSKKALMIASSTTATKRNISTTKMFVNTNTFTKQSSFKSLITNQATTIMMRGYATLPKGGKLNRNILWRIEKYVWWKFSD